MTGEEYLRLKGRELPKCNMTWRGDNGTFYTCELQKGHSNECKSQGLFYSETVEER